MNGNLALVISAVVSFFSVRWIYYKILKVAKLKSLVDNPDARKLQKAPIPVLGGLAVFFGMLMGSLCYAALTPDTGNIGANMAVLLATSAMLYVGSLDDMIGLTPVSRITIEVLAMLGLIYGADMCIDSLHGLWGVESFSWWIAVPLTVFAGVGLINAYNMIDGVNGLSSGLCIMCSAVLGVMFWKRHDMVDCVLAACFGASLIPFFLHNVFGNKSKMFIGDGGTMVMGMLVAWFCIRVLSSDNNVQEVEPGKVRMGLVAMMVSVASVPVADTLRVMLVRMVKGRSPFCADKTHLHHFFVNIGFSHSMTTMIEIAINLLVIGAWYISYKNGASVDWQLYITVIAAALLVWGSWAILRSRYLNEIYLEKLRSFNTGKHPGGKGWWLSLQGRLDRQAFEDFSVILQEKYGDDADIDSELAKAEIAIMNFIQGRGPVSVGETCDVCRLEIEKVMPIVEKLVDEGFVKVKNWKEDGSIFEIESVIQSMGGEN